MNWYLSYKKSKRKTFSHIGFLITALLIISISLTFLFLKYYENSFTSWFSDIIALDTIYIILIPVLVILFIKTKKTNNNDYKESFCFLNLINYFSLSLLFLLVFSYIGIGFVGIIEKLFNVKQLDIVGEVINSFNPIIEKISIIIIAPIFEEFLFRKCFIDITVKYGNKNAIFFSALCFGLFHCNFSQFFYAFGVGLIFGYIYIKTKNITYSIIIHAIINSSSYITMLLFGDIVNQDIDTLLANPNSQLYLFGVYSLIIIVFIANGIRFFMKNKVYNFVTITKGIDYPSIFTSTGFLCMLLISLSESISYLFI